MIHVEPTPHFTAFPLCMSRLNISLLCANRHSSNVHTTASCIMLTNTHRAVNFIPMIFLYIFAEVMGVDI